MPRTTTKRKAKAISSKALLRDEASELRYTKELDQYYRSGQRSSGIGV